MVLDHYNMYTNNCSKIMEYSVMVLVPCIAKYSVIAAHQCIKCRVLLVETRKSTGQFFILAFFQLNII